MVLAALIKNREGSSTSEPFLNCKGFIGRNPLWSFFGYHERDVIMPCNLDIMHPYKAEALGIIWAIVSDAI
jgi:hypothetical protein